jgi:hypothetical protein
MWLTIRGEQMDDLRGLFIALGCCNNVVPVKTWQCNSGKKRQIPLPFSPGSMELIGGKPQMRLNLAELCLAHGARYTNLSWACLGQIPENSPKSFSHSEADLAPVRELQAVKRNTYNT